MPFPSPGDPPNAGIELVSLMSPALAGRFFTMEPPGRPSKEETPYTKGAEPSPETGPHKYSQVIPDKGAKAISEGGIHFSTNSHILM